MLDAVFGREQFKNEVVWAYRTGGVSKRWFGRKHDTIFFFYAKGRTYLFNVLKERSPNRDNTPYRFKGVDEFQDDQGNWYTFSTLRDVWEINAIGRTSGERLGYPTQKPLALLDRIIAASSNPGDVILDPFCGCGTAIESAENGNRNWIEIDITYAAISAIQERFRRNRLDVWEDVQIEGKPETVEEIDTTLLNQSSPLYARKEFEKFCVASIGGMPNNKMGADGGIDGRIPLEEGKRALVSVKSGNVGVAQLRELKGLLDAKHVAGVFITRQPPTRPMVEFANTAGVVEIERPRKGLLLSHTCPVLQIITLEDILTGKPVDLPRPARKV